MTVHLADLGMPIEKLQKFLGHKDISTTRIYYEPDRVNVRRSFREAMALRGGK